MSRCTATKTTAAILARRVHALDAELAVIDEQLGPLVKAAAPELLNIYGVGVDTAAVLLVTAGDNPQRITLRRRLGDAVRDRPDPRDERPDRRTGSGSTAAATATPTTRSGGS